MNCEEYDLIIIGGGIAGLTAGIYACRSGLNTVLLEKLCLGGMTVTTDWVENYPGFPQGIAGFDLAGRIEEQARRFDLKVVQSEVYAVKLQGKQKIVKTKESEYRAKSVILATGTQPKKLNVPGEEKFRGRGVSYCATCDGLFFKGKDIAIVGTGNSGIQEGLFLLKLVKSATFVELLPYVTADKILQKRMEKKKGVHFFLDHILTSINGHSKVESITVKDRKTKQEKTIPVQGVFIYAGLIPNTDFVKGEIRLTRDGFIAADKLTQTSLSGVFAAGDVRDKNLRQIVTAAADGAQAAYMAEKYIEDLKQ